MSLTQKINTKFGEEEVEKNRQFGSYYKIGIRLQETSIQLSNQVESNISPVLSRGMPYYNSTACL